MERAGRVKQPATVRRRAAMRAKLLVLFIFLGLGFALFRIQVVRSGPYVLQARENRMRPLAERAPRGTVYDRHGRVVAENAVGQEVLLMPGPRDQMSATLEQLRPILGLTQAQVEKSWRSFRRASGLPMVVAGDAPPAAVAQLEERHAQFPGVLVRPYPQRRYPAGAAVAPLIGYVAEISEQELARPSFVEYQQGRWIGKAGLERQYEPLLGGAPGKRYLEVDARGRIKRWLPAELGIAAVPGRDLQLHLDLDLQEYVAEMFDDVRMHADLAGMDTVQGAFVALDPRTGGVLAYYSTPGFDPNRFIGGIQSDIWKTLNSDRNKPLLDRVAGSGAPQPPGSTFKLMLAAMALQDGIITPASHMAEPCTGGFWFQGRYAKCWCDGCYWDFDLVQAIQNSCNVYFYQLGIKLGLERFLEKGTELGLRGRPGSTCPASPDRSFRAASVGCRTGSAIVPPRTRLCHSRLGRVPFR